MRKLILFQIATGTGVRAYVAAESIEKALELFRADGFTPVHVERISSEVIVG